MAEQPQRIRERNTYEPFQPPKRLLLGPGPSPVEDRVLAAMSAPVLGHLDPLFLECMDDIQEMLRYVFETDNRVTIPISATGSAGMEAALVNVIEPGDEIVVCINGVFMRSPKTPSMKSWFASMESSANACETSSN